MNSLQLLQIIITELKLIETKYKAGLITGLELEEQTETTLKFYLLYLK